ncbi:MAG: aminoglycoside 6-adenylyltransferase [Lachnospiraceae bacterium]
MDRYFEIKKRLISLAKSDEDIKAVVLIGSSTRDVIKADEYSDLDVIIASDNTEKWLFGDYPEKLGDVKISFVEPTLGGGQERRVLFDGALDVDMIVFTPEQFESAIKEGVASFVMNRGYEVLYDSENFSVLLKENISAQILHSDLSEAEFNNIVNDFFFHTVWASKKILRGELWSAKMCVDAYLKNNLLKIIEAYSSIKNNVDVWHDGRFLDRWAEKEILADLKTCFAHYNKEDLTAALFSTEKLFARLAEKTAEIKGYKYPDKAEKYAEKLLNEYFGCWYNAYINNRSLWYCKARK